MPTSRLATMTTILAKVRDIKSLKMSCFTSFYGYGSDQRFHVELCYDEQGDGKNQTKVEVTRYGAEFADALIEAWNEIEHVVSKGIGPKALEKPVEHIAIPAREANHSPAD